MTNFNNERNVASKWEICPSCCGDGKTSAHLGAFSSERFDDEFSYDEREAYFRGDYDKECGHCNGSGKVMVRADDSHEARLLAWEYEQCADNLFKDN